MKRWLLHSLLGRFFALLTVSVAAGLASFALLHQLMSPWTSAIQQQIENPLARAILEGKFAAKDTIRVSCENGIIRFNAG